MTKDEFIEKLRNSASAPFLFLGAGFSRHYLGAPQWKDLLKEQVPQGKHINQYTTNVEDPHDLTQIASAIARDINTEFWNLPETDPKRIKYQEKAENQSYVIKAQISDKLEAYPYNEAFVNYKEEIELLQKLNIGGIITTNYDLLAEKIFDKYKVYIGQQELITSSSMGIGEIYKIHGCITDPNSLVLTKEDYEAFDSKNPYLAAKLLTIFMEHPIIFIGYSISDPNIQRILDSIVNCLDDASLARIQNNLIFINWVPEDTNDLKIDTTSLKMQNGKLLPVIKIDTHNYTPIFECLSHYEEQIPVHILRLVKEHFYNIILSQKPEKQLYGVTTDLNDANIRHLQFVYGIGVIPKFKTPVGYKGINPIDIYKDVIEENGEYDALSILHETIPDIRRRYPSTSLPVYKYMHEVGITNQTEYNNNTQNIHIDIKYNKLEDFQTYSFAEEDKRKTIDTVIANYPTFGWKTVALIPYLQIDDTDLPKLRNFIRNHIDEFLASKKAKYYKNSTYMRKLICYYDWRMYGWKD